MAPKQFDALVNIRWLNLSNNQIKDFHKNEFIKLEKLNILDISCNKLKECSFLLSFSEIHNITELNLFNNKIKEFSFSHNSLKNSTYQAILYLTLNFKVNV